MIYVLHAEGTGLVKIGFTNRPIEQRISALQTGSPAKLRLVCVMAGQKCAETALHQKYDRFRERGEWFRLPTHTLSELIQVDTSTAAAITCWSNVKRHGSAESVVALRYRVPDRFFGPSGDRLYGWSPLDFNCEAAGVVACDLADDLNPGPLEPFFRRSLSGADVAAVSFCGMVESYRYMLRGLRRAAHDVARAERLIDALESTGIEHVAVESCLVEVATNPVSKLVRTKNTRFEKSECKQCDEKHGSVSDVCWHLLRHWQLDHDAEVSLSIDRIFRDNGFMISAQGVPDALLNHDLIQRLCDLQEQARKEARDIRLRYLDSIERAVEP